MATIPRRSAPLCVVVTPQNGKGVLPIYLRPALRKWVCSFGLELMPFWLVVNGKLRATKPHFVSWEPKESKRKLKDSPFGEG